MQPTVILAALHPRARAARHGAESLVCDNESLAVTSAMCVGHDLSPATAATA
jgi:hypothetical protein